MATLPTLYPTGQLPTIMVNTEFTFLCHPGTILLTYVALGTGADIK